MSDVITRQFYEKLNIENIPWHRLKTPYGRGDDLPEYLACLEKMSDSESVTSSSKKIASLIEHQGTLWHVTPFTVVFLGRILQKAQQKADTSEAARVAVRELGELFSTLWTSIQMMPTVDCGVSLPQFSSLLDEKCLWPDDDSDDDIQMGI